MRMFFAPLKLKVYFSVLTYDRRVWSMLMIKDGAILCWETNADMFLWKVKFSSTKNWGEESTFLVEPLSLLHLSFPNTPLDHLLVNTRSPSYYFKRFGLFALTTPVAILMSWHFLMTPWAIHVPIAMSLTFFSIPESNRLGLPILFITVQSPSLPFFFQVFTVVRKEYFNYLVVNFLIAKVVPKSLAYRPTSFLIFAGILTWYFFGRLYVFCISSSAYASSTEVTFSITEVRTLLIWIPSVPSLLCDFLLNYARILSLFIFFSQAKSHRINCKALKLLLLIIFLSYAFELHSNICYALLPHFYTIVRFYTLSNDKNLCNEEFPFELQ